MKLYTLSFVVSLFIVRASRQREPFQADDFFDWKDMKTLRKGDDKNWIAFWKSPLEEGSMRRKVLLKDYKSKEAFENERRINEKIGVSNIEDDDGNENLSEIARYYGHFKREKRTYGYTGVHNPIYIYTLVFKYYEAEDLFDYSNHNNEYYIRRFFPLLDYLRSLTNVQIKPFFWQR